MKIATIVTVLLIFASSAMPAVVSISPDKLTFGSVVVGSSATNNVGINNPTKNILNILSVTIDGDFFINNTCGPVVPVSSGCGWVVSFAPTISGLRTGTLTITTDSTGSPYKIKLSGTGVPLQMIRIDVTPTNPVAPKGSTQQFTALGVFNDGTVQDLTNSSVWNSSAPSIATISTTGLASALTAGNTTIKAVNGSLTGSVTMTVGPAVLRSLSITPQTTAIPKGATQQFVATGTFTDGATQNLTNSVQWTSTMPGIATINSTGLATGVGVGQAGIRCALGSVDSGIYPSLLTVTAPGLTSIIVTPANASIAVGGTVQYTATGVYTDGSTANITGSATWSCSNFISCISPGGLATGLGLGNVTIYATAPGWVPPGTIGAPGVIGQTNLECGGVFSTLLPMSTPRILHTATMLSSGKVLLAGGEANVGCCSLSSAELYDPANNAFGGTGFMTMARQNHTATLLNNGTVLVAGGDTAGAAAELYDPGGVGSFMAIGSMTAARTNHTATLLQNGLVLIAGGSGATAELYNPSAGTFVLTGSMGTARGAHTAVLLENGQVLIAGGLGPNGPLSSAELYNPLTGAFTSVGTMAIARAHHRATLLNGGKVLLTGGMTTGGAQTAGAELFDPATGLFTATGSMNFARDTHTATLLTSGQVLIVAGEGSGTVLSTSEKYDPASGAFSLTGSTDFVHFDNTRVGHTTTLLGDGQALVAGGFPITAAAGLYQPSVRTPPGLFQVAVTPGPVTIAVGATQPFSATGNFINGTQQTLHSVFWVIQGNPIAVVNADGVATALGAGQTQVGAFGGPLTGQSVPAGSATLNVQ